MRLCLEMNDHELDLVRRMIRVYKDGPTEAKAIMDSELAGLTWAKLEETILRAEAAM